MFLKQAVTSTFFLKATSLIIGFLLWSIISDACTGHTWVTVPLCFYNKKNLSITSPENLLVQLKAKRSFLKHLDTRTLAAHIDAQTLHVGPNTVHITEDLLFLPSTITIQDIIPHNILITVQDGLS